MRGAMPFSTVLSKAKAIEVETRTPFRRYPREGGDPVNTDVNQRVKRCGVLDSRPRGNDDYGYSQAAGGGSTHKML
jgi:hypothetical protein